jgi:hypothetical protein
MGEPRLPEPVLLIVAAFSRHRAVLEEVAARLEERFGPVALASPPYAFNHTRYYEPTMGPSLCKQLLAFQNLVAADCLVDVKQCTNSLEAEWAGGGLYPEPRPLNLDPGLLTLGKFMLATTKDQAHRIYVGQGIFAEVTLSFQTGAYEPWPWTYADYREAEVRAFLGQARVYYRQRLAQTKAEASARPNT